MGLLVVFTTTVSHLVRYILRSIAMPSPAIISIYDALCIFEAVATLDIVCVKILAFRSMKLQELGYSECVTIFGCGLALFYSLMGRRVYRRDAGQRV